MSTSARVEIRLKFASLKQVVTLLDALTPEANTPVTKRANVKLEKDGLNLLLTADAEDTVALRATLNAFLHWISSIVKVIDTVECT